MTSCAVVGCKSTNDKKRKKAENATEIIFNRFPRDEKLRKVWLQRCGLKDDCKAKRLYVCIRHFTPADYVRNLKHKFWNYYAKSCRKVRIDAIPSLFLPPYVVILPEPEIVKETKKFPRDEQLRKVWLQQCGREADCKTKRLYVCMKHFTPADYMRNLRHELLNYYPKSCRKVKIDAIPSLCLPPCVFIPPETEMVKETKKSSEKNPNAVPNIDAHTQAIQFEFIDHVVIAYLNRCRSRAGNTNVGMSNYILKAKAQEAAILLGAKHVYRFHWIDKFKKKLAEKDAMGVVLTSIPESLSIADIINDEWPKFADEKGLDIDHRSEDTISSNTECPRLTEYATLSSKEYQRQGNEDSIQTENITSSNVGDSQAQNKDTDASICSRFINPIVEERHEFMKNKTSQKENVVNKKSESDPQQKFLSHVLAAFIKRYNASWPQADIPETVLNAKFKQAAKILGLTIRYKNVWLFEFKRGINYNNEAILTEPYQSLDICDIIKEERPKFDLLNDSSISQDCELKEVITIKETNTVDKSEQIDIECCDSIQTYEEARDCLSLLNNYALEVGDCGALSLIKQVNSFLRSDNFEE